MGEELVDEGFSKLLEPYDPDVLRIHEGAIYGLWPDLRFAYFNPAWFTFSEQNGGEPRLSRSWTLGSSLLDALPPALRLWYHAHYSRVLNADSHWTHEYECSSRDVYRRFHQVVYTLGRGRGLLVVNSLVVEAPHDLELCAPLPPDEPLYLSESGLITQCAHCRRTQRRSDPNRWDWVPTWVERMPLNVTHAFCPTCYGFYFKDPSWSDDVARRPHTP